MSVPTPRLPARPSLEQLRKQAKELLRAHRSGDTAAVERVRAVIPRIIAAGEAATLADAQFVIAREAGFASWAELARYVRRVNPATASGLTSPLIRPIEMTVPSIALADGDVASSDDVYAIFVATRAGDVEGVRRIVARHASLATYEYNYTPPIHFAVREGHASLVRFFLERGADPAYRTYPYGDSLLTMAEEREHTEVAAVVRSALAARFGDALDVTALVAAAKDGDVALVDAELARDARLARHGNETGNTALHEAAHNGRLEVVRTLLDAGAPVDAVRSDGWRPVHAASMPNWRAGVAPERARAIADLLLARGATYTMFLAALRGDEPYVRAALARDASLANAEDSCHRRPLSAAASQMNLELVKLLLAHGADPRLPEAGARGGSALWDAVYRKQHEMARLLLEHGADPNAVVESSGTPMMHARKDPVLLELLTRYGGTLETDDVAMLGRLIGDDDRDGVDRLLRRRPELARDDRLFWNEGILAGPAHGNNLDMIRLLMRHGARVPTVSKWGPFYYFKHYDIASLLLAGGMDPNHMNWHRTTLLHHFAAKGDAAKVALLLDHGASIDAIDEEYRSTPLGMAARSGQREIVSHLLDRGADPAAAGAAWSTPLAWARKRGHSDIEKMLDEFRLGRADAAGTTIE